MFDNIARKLATLTLKIYRKLTDIENKRYIKQKAKYDAWLSKLTYDILRASLICSIKHWNMQLVCVDDLADAVLQGGSHYCAFWKGSRIFKKNHIGTSFSDNYNDAAKKLIAEYVPYLNKSVSELKLLLAIQEGY